MELSVSVLFYNLLGLFVLVGVGFLAVRAAVIPGSASGIFSALLMKVTMPVTIFVSMLRPFETAFLRESLLLILLGFVLLPLFSVLARLGAQAANVSEGRRGTWSYCTTFPNSGAMGFPVASALFGERGLALAVMLNIPVNVLIYTVGIKMMCADRPRDGSLPGVPWRTVLCTPVNLGMALGLVCYCLQITLPEAVMLPLNQLAGVTTPLAMMTIGMTLAGGRWQDVVGDRDVRSAALVRLVIFPLMAWAVLLLLPAVDLAVRGVFLVIMAMPAPAVSSIAAEQYGGDRELAARTVFFTSLLCVISIPLVVTLL